MRLATGPADVATVLPTVSENRSRVESRTKLENR